MVVPGLARSTARRSSFIVRTVNVTMVTGGLQPHLLQASTCRAAAELANNSQPIRKIAPNVLIFGLAQEIIIDS
jgi:hypothetical protein